MNEFNKLKVLSVAPRVTASEGEYFFACEDAKIVKYYASPSSDYERDRQRKALKCDTSPSYDGQRKKVPFLLRYDCTFIGGLTLADLFPILSFVSLCKFKRPTLTTG